MTRHQNCNQINVGDRGWKVTHDSSLKIGNIHQKYMAGKTWAIVNELTTGVMTVYEKNKTEYSKKTLKNLQGLPQKDHEF